MRPSQLFSHFFGPEAGCFSTAESCYRSRYWHDAGRRFRTPGL